MIGTLQTVKKIPAHLRPYVAQQHYKQYTPINQAVWRYVMRQNFHFFKHHAHSTYQHGLEQSGILIDRIPRVVEMDACLAPFGWGAVPIDGLIPGVVFFDFQAHGLLPIATDIRTLEHLSYTPAPDIIHEAAGHAPILCDETYARYVKRFGEIGSKAIATKEEHAIFEATRQLSIIMEQPNSTEEMIAEAQRHLEHAIAQSTEVSEATQISRLYWWTVEYGLIGELDNPSIYGAGLLSSIGEGQSCLSDKVAKIPFDLETCIQTDYDVTKPQPQLFVCQSFEQLIEAVEQFAERMAFRVGGTESLLKAVRSEALATAEYSSGLQVSGVISTLIQDLSGEAIYMQTTGPTALAHQEVEINGHGKQTHFHGFGSPIGKVKGFSKPLEQLTIAELEEHQIWKGKEFTLQFESGVEVRGIIRDWIHRGGKLLLLSFNDCTVTYQGEHLFQPDWGTYDMAVGEQITSVFAGAADPEAFFAEVDSQVKTSDPLIPSAVSTLDHLYQAVRDIREGKREIGNLPTILVTLDQLYPEDWLLRIEILEICCQSSEFIESEMKSHVLQTLQQIKKAQPQLQSVIDNGIRLAHQP